MNSTVQQNPMLVPARMPHMPGMPGSYVPPWVVPTVPGEMVYGTDATQTMPVMSNPPLVMTQMATRPMPLMPIANRAFIPQPVLTDPNAMYNLPPVASQQWIG